jgi:hypothetical protein
MNHLAYVRIGDDFMREALRLIREDPKRYGLGVVHAWFVYFESSSYFKHFQPNRTAIAWLDRAWGHWVYGEIDRGLPFRGERKPVWIVLLLGLPAVFAFGAWLAARPPDASRLDPAARAVLIVLCVQIAFVAVVSNLLQVGENNRFRFITDPLSMVLLGLALSRIASWRRRTPAAPRRSS